jgi:hypothetical protein
MDGLALSLYCKQYSGEGLTNQEELVDGFRTGMTLRMRLKPRTVRLGALAEDPRTEVPGH